MRETNGNPKKLRFYAGCENPPIPIYNPDQGDVPILILFPPAPLHLLLGAGNDALKCMEGIWTDTGVMQDFYKYNGYKKGNTTGGKGLFLSRVYSGMKYFLIFYFRISMSGTEQLVRYYYLCR